MLILKMLKLNISKSAEVEYIEINGYQAMLIRKNSELQLVWPAKGSSIVVDVTASNLEEEVFLHIASELIY